MKEKKQINKSALAVSFALLLVMLLLIGTFIVSQMKFNQENIVLPAGPTETELPSASDDLMEDTLIKIDPDNIIRVLETLKVPAYYHQCFELTVGNHRPRAINYVEIWVNGDTLRAECSSYGSSRTKSILTDGTRAWIWYNTDFLPISVQMKEMSAEDLLGLPGFDYLERLKQAQVKEASYAVLDESMQQCVYISALEESERTAQYWIDLKTGLLQDVKLLEGMEEAYYLHATSMELLAQGDSSYEGRFCLPDGTNPFLTEQ